MRRICKHCFESKGIQPKLVKRQQLTLEKQSVAVLPRLLPVVAAVLLSACSMQPVYKVPAMEVPAQFKEATPQAAALASGSPHKVV